MLLPRFILIIGGMYATWYSAESGENPLKTMNLRYHSADASI